MSSSHELGGWSIRFTDRRDGDFAPDSIGVDERRAEIVGSQPVLWLRQVHGSDVVVVDSIDDVQRCAGANADAAVTTSAGIALSVVTADCAPIVLVAGHVGAVVHAGWLGLVSGVVTSAVTSVRSLAGPARPVKALVGPCIHPASYEFGDHDLERLADRFGDGVRGRTMNGRAALDLPGTVVASLRELDVPASLTFCADTSSRDRFSHRVRADPERQALFLWRST